jgi:hypothetical protein
MVALIALIFNPTVILKGTRDIILERSIWFIAVQHSPALDSFSLVVGATRAVKFFIKGRYEVLGGVLNTLGLECVVVVWAIPVIRVGTFAKHCTNPGIHNMVALIAFIFDPTVILEGTLDIILEGGIWFIAVEHRPALDSFSLVVGATRAVEFFIKGRYEVFGGVLNTLGLECVVVVWTVPVIGVGASYCCLLFIDGASV